MLILVIVLSSEGLCNLVILSLGQASWSRKKREKTTHDYLRSDVY
jgi:hypothetical protein